MIAATREARAKSKTLSLRLSDEMRERLDRVSKMGPYEVSYTAIIERGIILAENEMKAINASLNAPGEGG